MNRTTQVIPPRATPTITVTRAVIEEEVERFRQFVVASRATASVAEAATVSRDRLNEMFQANRTLFSEEDVRWLNVLCGSLGVRLAAHAPRVEHTRKAKRKGDRLDHCWRCETPVDERFDEICTACTDKSYQWRVCPVCRACGCQRSGQRLV